MSEHLDILGIKVVLDPRLPDGTVVFVPSLQRNPGERREEFERRRALATVYLVNVDPPPRSD